MIHKTAIIDNKAIISKDVEIGPYAVVGPNVSIETDTIIHSHVSITGNTKIGSGNEIFPFVSIGQEPQDLKYKGENNSLIIGNKNKIREYVTINPGTEGGGSVTRIGNENLIMIQCHIAHDCQIGNNVVLANNTQIAGHVKIENKVIIGGSSAVHQFVRIGELSMIGGLTGVTTDVIPYALSVGNRNYLEGLNLIGLRRSNISNEDIKFIDNLYKELFKNAEYRKNINNLSDEVKENFYVNKILNFINSDKKRAICIPENIR